LLTWFDATRRALPWRRNADAWRVLVSETMLQQTTVATVSARFEDFMARFPTPLAMTQASEDDVLAAWSGLGYYGRARRLRQAAVALVARGVWPEKAEGLLRLPGIGPYTAAAVASIAFGEPVAAIDTNVRRVLARLHACGGPLAPTAAQRRIEAWATERLDAERPGDYNQAMMELGATVCTSEAPRCEACPVARWCVAHREGRQDSIPFRVKREAATPRNDIALGIARGPGADSLEVLLWRRPAGSVYHGMTELPTWRGEESTGAKPLACGAAWIAGQLGLAPDQLQVEAMAAVTLQHTITRYRVRLDLHLARLRGELASEERPFAAAWHPLGEAERIVQASPQRRLLSALRQQAEQGLRQEELF